ncbi:MAG: phage tail protein, partial [Candidatus Nezhaarchaeales archaeon]
PVTLSGQTMFIQRTGKSLNSFVFSDDQQANTTNSLSILSPHLIKNPIKVSIQRGAPDSDANYIYIVNDDGTATVLNSLPFENIAAFTRWETDGDILSCAVVGEKVYFLTSRSGTVSLEVENDALNMDNGEVLAGSISSINGLSRLNNREISIKTNDYYYGDEVVSGGTVQLDKAYTTIEYGLPFSPEMVTMPMNVNLQTGSALYKKKRLKRVALDIYQSNGIIVNGNRIYDRTIGLNQFDAPVPISGVFRRYLYGWHVVAKITIKQDTPYPFQVLSIGVEVAL